MEINSDEGTPAGSNAGKVSPTTVFRFKQHHPLNAIFEPRSVAVVGAMEKAGSIGRTVLWNLISNPFGGTVFPVNARRASVLGIKAYPGLAALPEYELILGVSRRVAHDRLIGICFIDYDREMALVAAYHNPQTEQDEIIGVGRLIKVQGVNEAEFALLVTDLFQRKGLGTELLRLLMQVGRDEKLQRLTGDILAENLGMQAVCKKFGFHLRYSLEEHTVQAELDL
jgi:GNAT superfamily N-acetyltransferase